MQQLFSISACKQHLIKSNIFLIYYIFYLIFQTFKNCQDPAYVSVLLKGKQKAILFLGSCFEMGLKNLCFLYLLT
jgi:hypothetical protein